MPDARLSARHILPWGAAALGTLVLLWVLGPILTPFVMAAVLGYMLEPGVTWLVRRRLPRPLAVLLMILALVLVVVALALVVVPIVVKEGAALSGKLPLLLDRLNSHVAPRLGEWLNTEIRFDFESARSLLTEKLAESGDGIYRSVFDSLRIGTGKVMGVVGLLALVPVVLFYLLLDWNLIVSKIARLIPLPLRPRVTRLVGEVDAVLAQFLRGQIVVMLALAAFYSVGLVFTGLDVALPVGIITGLLVFVPYIGYSLGLVLAVLSGLLQFGSWGGLVGIAIVYSLGQALESFVLTPRLVGERIGLHPITVIFALMAFGQLFGFVGVLVALPVSAVLAVGVQHLLRHYFDSPLYHGGDRIVLAKPQDGAPD
ncbi:AI-2E family transporter [Derxia gummosa]|uniref:AI-2E family transporter n=1 Tax=Derxia gummosa DSM 723 TaxID=1121388 RepID=A0A8B6XAI3_9BURK|nr:AI-2E family transporter [Derxia gummosa]